MVFAKSALDQADAGLAELAVVFPQRGGEADGGDLGGFGFHFVGFRVVGGYRTIFEVGDALGGIGVFGDHLSFVFLEDAGDLPGVVLFLGVGEV